jgi:HEAT repeat protein/beta-lactamase regulating signal transducer with metallopeptidase domain
MTGAMGDVTVVLPGLLDASVKGSVLLLAVFGGAWALRRSAAATRHRLWAAGMVALLALPVMSWWVPWRIEVLPIPALTAGGTGASPALLQAPSMESPERALEQAAVPRASQQAVQQASPSTWSGPGSSLGERDVPAGWDAPERGRESLLAAGSWAVLLAFLWLGGVVLALVRLTRGWLVARSIVAGAEPLTNDVWAGELRRISRQLGLVRSTRLVQTDRTPLAFTTGLFRPVVVLPTGCAEWSADRRRAVLLHELAHVLRGDLIMQLVSSLTRAAYWFNPLVWVAARRLRAEGERAADDAVLTMGTRASSYAGELLEMVKSARPHRAPATVLPMAQASDFEGRLLAILEPDARRGAPSRWVRAWIAIAIAASSLPLAALSPGAAAKAAGPEGSDASGTALSGAAQEAVGSQEPVALMDAAEPRQTESSGAAEPEPTADPSPEPLSEPVIPQAPERDVGPVVVALIGALSDPVPEVRTEAAQALADRQDTAAVAALARALRADPDAEVRAMSAYSLGEIGSPSGVPALVEALGADAAAEVRTRAAWALGEIRDPAAVQGLVAALRDASPEVRRQAAWALGELREPEAVNGLVGALSDENPEVRRQAAWALGEIADARALDGLMAAVEDPDTEVRAQALWALAELGDPRAQPAFLRLLGDPEPEIRRRAVAGLAELDLATAPDGLLAAAGDESAEVRSRVARVLADIADPASVPTLETLLRDPEAEVRRYALRALAEIGDPSAIDAMIQALQDEDSEVRREAARALGRSDGLDLPLR